jgi:GAF domain-containing protein
VDLHHHADRNPAARFDALTQPTGHLDDVGIQFLPTRLCQAAVEVLAIDGAAISVRLGVDVSVPIGANDPEAAACEQLQFTLGEGPCLQATLSGKRVLVPDLERSDPPQAWPVYVIEAIRRTSYRAVFSFPLTLVGSIVGTLNLYRRSAGRTLSEDEIFAVHHITSRIATELRAVEVFDIADGESHYEWMNAASVQRRHQVSIAQGMTMQTNQVTASAALALLRAQAYAADRFLDDLAADIVNRRVPPLGLHS